MSPTTRRAASNQSVIFDSHTTPIASSSKSVQRSSSAPSAKSSPLDPLRAAKTVAGPLRSLSADRRNRVAFSPNNHTKLFNTNEPVVPEAPTSIRSYRTSSPEAISSSPSSHRASDDSTDGVRPILKRHDHTIRVAKSVKEGTWNNREPARLRVIGAMPRMDSPSMFLSTLDAAEDGIAGVPISDDAPPSDDSDSSGEGQAGGQPSNGQRGADNFSDESEEEEQEEGLHPSYLVENLLSGDADLLTLEESYTSLTLRLRESLFDIGPPTLAVHTEFEHVCKEIRDEAPAIVCAIQRDLNRLMGKVPNSETTASTSPFRGLTPAFSLPPSPQKTPKRGYTESEVLYRREAAGVGCAALRFLTVVFSSPRLFTLFTEADVQALLDQVLVIPRTPILPTPSPKRTFSQAIMIFSQVRLPSAWIRPLESKITRSLESALTTVAVGVFALKDPSPIRKEAFNAVNNLLKMYPDIFFPAYTQLLPVCLRTLSSPLPALRKSASAATAAFQTAKLRLQDDADRVLQDDSSTQTAWNKTRSVVVRSEAFVANFLRGVLKSPRSKSAYDKDGEKSTEWSPIEAIFRRTVGTAEEVAWACSTWAILVSLIGKEFSSSPLVKDIGHIMDRSLQPSTNAVRPTLASAAWQHAIHAYLHAGSTASLSESGRVVRSYNAFSASSYEDVDERLRTIALPVGVSLAQASDTKHVARALTTRPDFNNEQRWSWQRAEKPRKLAWMITTGLVAPALLYAYTVIALTDEDQPAREVTRMSGLPSSDGIVVDISPEERRLPRLDRTFDLVLMPILKQFFGICGVDRLKNLGWEMLEAVTAAPLTGPLPKLERLLSRRYLSGEILHLDKVAPEVVDKFDADFILPSEIPGWGRLWAAKRLGKLLALFEEAFDGIRGVNDLAAVEWVTNADGLVLLPTVLSRIWGNLLRALAITDIPESPPTPLFIVGLQAITRQIVSIFQRDPTTYMPICLLDASGKSTLNTDAIRLGVTLHLFNVAVEVLGEKTLGATLINQQFNRNPAEESPFAAEALGQPTVVGNLLGPLTRSKLSSTMDPKVRQLFCQLVIALLNTGSTRDIGTRLLGEVSNSMPWIFENDEQMQLDVWRLLALKWSEVIDLQPAATASATNHTGEVLVSLLSCPFRNAEATSVWYNNPSTEDLEAWQSLLKVSILRFRAKRVGSNFGVLETLSAHLDDFIRVQDDDSEQTKQRKASTTTISCLAAAMSWISFVPTEHYHAAHYSINENFVPVDFLAFVSSALVAAFDSASDTRFAAVGKLVQNITALFQSLPPDSVADVLDPLRPGLAVWMTDVPKSVPAELGAQLDDLYVAVLHALTIAIENNDLPAASVTMNEYIDMYAPRLSRGTSSAVPTAFQDFWRRSFQSVEGLDYSDDVAGFVRDVLTALPGYIMAEGLSLQESSASLDQFPYAESVPIQVAEPEAVAVEEAAEPEPVVEGEVDEEAAPEPSEEAPLANTSANYDADVSASIPPPTQTRSGRLRRSQSRSQEAPLVADSSASSPADTSDVFGPTKARRVKKANKLARTKSLREARLQERHDAQVALDKSALSRSKSWAATSRRKSPRRASSSPPVEAIDMTVIPGTDDEAGDDEEQFGKTQVPFHSSRSDEEAARGLFSSASRWLRKVPSIGSLFTPTQAELSQRAQHTSRSFDRLEELEEDNAEADTPLASRPLRHKSHKSRKSQEADQPHAVQERSEPHPEPSAMEDEPRSTGSSRDSTPASQASTRRKRAASNDEAAKTTKRRRRASRKAVRDSRSRSRSQSFPPDEDDELLLSPESAERARREEQRLIAEDDARIERLEQQASPLAGRRGAEEPEEEDEDEFVESGAFDDAPDDESPTTARTQPAVSTPDAGPSSPTADAVVEPPAFAPTPIRRTAVQQRVLSMVEQAADAHAAIASLDFDGVIELLGNAERLRALATAALQAQAEQARQERRRRRASTGQE